MANSFDFELKADDQVSESLQRIHEAVQNLLPSLDKTQTGLQLGGQQSVDGLSTLSDKFQGMAKNARDGVQFIGDIVPPLKMVTGLTVGLGGVAKVINIVKNGVMGFAESGYRIQTTAKNIGLTTRAFQQLTGAMIENGATRSDAENSIASLYQRANEAVQGRDNSFLALLASNGIGISKTKEGVADVNKLLDDMHSRLYNLSPALQAVFGNAAGLSPDLLNYLRQSGDEIQRLKDQAQRDGLIFSNQDIQNAMAFREQINQISSSWDGMLMQTQSWLGQSELVKNSLEEVKQLITHGPDNVTMSNIMGFNNGGKQADMLRQAYGDENFKKTLSLKEKSDLYLGYASPELMKQIDSYYRPVQQAMQLLQDVKTLSVIPPASPQGQPAGNALGIRNNNQGNLRSAPNSTGKNGGFVTFATPNDGLAALSRQLMLYGDRGNNTLNGIIHTYAPSKENNTQAYINAVSQQTGFDPRQRLNLSDPVVLQKLMTAIIQHENGTQPYNPLDIMNGINTAINDNRWSGLRNPTVLSAQRDGNYTGNEIPTVMPPSDITPIPPILPAQRGGGIIDKDITTALPPGIAPVPSINAGTVNSSQAIADAIATAMKDNKTLIELTMVNSQTGEKKTMTVRAGGKITTSMEY
ncbi:hypothetical protein GTU79_21115 [Sodalis ligni]|uniref:hypothetical protein n=1 Tax=Sodalis ligni TaxID=2697027 RepID=UPI00193F4F3A|nr:hypothetical protein [Sodalis ligni]QWA09788.1 hypothetical protein GTU79_21115 [Sodalis ligni]